MATQTVQDISRQNQKALSSKCAGKSEANVRVWYCWSTCEARHHQWTLSNADQTSPWRLCHHQQHEIYWSFRLGGNGERWKEVQDISIFGLWCCNLYQNRKAREILGIFRELQKRDFSNDDSLVCCILSHGEEGKIFGSDSRAVELDDIKNLFTAKECPKLQGKPKLFFIQACHGKVQTKALAKWDPGYKVQADDDGKTRPNMADFFFGYATAPGHVALHDPAHGSWYISELCEVFVPMQSLLSWSRCIRKLITMLVNMARKERKKHLSSIFHWSKTFTFSNLPWTLVYMYTI